MMPTSKDVQAIESATVQGLYVRSHAGGIVRSLIHSLQQERINVWEGTIEAGEFILAVPFPRMFFTEALDQLAKFASINAEGVAWGWKIDHLARVHFAPLDHLPQG